jgi:hypothetical protein
MDYLDHLTDTDLQVLASAVGLPRGPELLRQESQLVPRLLDRPEAFDAGVGRSSSPATTGGMVAVSPFLVFALAMHHAARELACASYVTERSGPRGRVPVFDAAQLAEFLHAPERRLFLSELLASFARVASGRYWSRGAGGWRSRRFSELDPVQLAGLIEAMPEPERPGAYRRVGDAALFLAGVFPDYTRSHALRPVDADRLLRQAGATPDEQRTVVAAPAIELFEHVAAAYYRQACAAAPVRTAHLSVVADVAERVRQARRVLNHVADRYLFPAGNPWFPSPAG